MATLLFLVREAFINLRNVKFTPVKLTGKIRRKVATTKLTVLCVNFTRPHVFIWSTSLRQVHLYLSRSS